MIIYILLGFCVLAVIMSLVESISRKDFIKWR